MPHTSKAQRLALFLSYDGSRFFGWQKQAAGIPTVQDAVETALSTMANEPINIIAAGRTDTGVHATAQVIHFTTHAKRPQQAWIRGVNALLPDGVAVWQAQEVAPHFHARFDACGRHYRYVLQSSATRSPLLLGKAGWTHYPLDADAIRQALTLLQGTQDFSSFRASQCQAKSPIKTLYQANLTQQDEWYLFDFHANAFLHHMIRNIIGAMVYIGAGKLSLDEFAKLIAERSRLKAPPPSCLMDCILQALIIPAIGKFPPPPIPTWLHFNRPNQAT